MIDVIGQEKSFFNMLQLNVAFEKCLLLYHSSYFTHGREIAEKTINTSPTY